MQRAKRPAKAISTPMMMSARSASAAVNIEDARTAQMAITTMPAPNRVAATKIGRRSNRFCRSNLALNIACKGARFGGRVANLGPAPDDALVFRATSSGFVFP